MILLSLSADALLWSPYLGSAARWVIGSSLSVGFLHVLAECYLD